MRLNILTQYMTYQLYHALVMLREISMSKKSDDVHEFRVAIRRVRSILKLYAIEAPVFPDALKAAVKATNAIRELDVLLDSIDKTKYPKTHSHLSTLRREEADVLFSDTFKHETSKILWEYYDLLNKTNPSLVTKTLIQTVEKAYREALKEYDAIDENTPQKQLHRLRVRFKNLRYGLEFLAINALKNEEKKIVECKSVQNTLGAVQDAYNQIAWLKELEKRFPSDETKKLLVKRKQKLKRLKAANRSV